MHCLCKVKGTGKEIFLLKSVLQSCKDLRQFFCSPLEKGQPWRSRPPNNFFQASAPQSPVSRDIDRFCGQKIKNNAKMTACSQLLQHIKMRTFFT
jgi:hypothetical protein